MKLVKLLNENRILFDEVEELISDRISAIDQEIERLKQQQKQLKSLIPQARTFAKLADQHSWGKGVFSKTSKKRDAATEKFESDSDKFETQLKLLKVIGDYDSLGY